ncbi:MAG: hypothetical protein A2Y15_02415 [Clostridiales bacterium GWF2_36_10]|nr:MAG: hypothetical protein A2Y15_02415 [Clostridiales bacterium GWF2_36_10]
MKKIALFLAFIFLLSAITSCDKNDESSDVSDISGESNVSEDGIIPISHSTVVSLNKSYESSVKADTKYEDTYSSELTDGIFAEGESVSYTDSKLSGYNNTTSIIIDLKNDGKRLYKFAISYLSTTVAGISPMAEGRVYISDDKDNKDSWTSLGAVVKPAPVEGIMQEGVLELEKPVNGRYVKFIIQKASAWVFLDELTVYADIKGTGDALEYLKLLNDSYANDNLTNEERISALSKVIGEQVDRTKKKILISEGCKFQSSYAPSNNEFVNDGIKLTNGSDIDSSYESDVWVGYAGGEQLDLTVTLASERNDLAEFALSMYNRPSTDIKLPAYVDISVSTDNETYTLVGRVYATSNEKQKNYTYLLSLTQGVKGKYIRFTLSKTECKYFLIEETAVYVYSDENFISSSSVYPAVNLPAVTEKTYWDAGSSDYKNKINLIQGKDYQIASGVILDKTTEAQYNDFITNKKLTDGVESNNTSYTNGLWYRMHGGVSRNIYFDLEHSSTITGFAVNFLNYDSVGIFTTNILTLYLSDDGVNWYAVKTLNAPSVKETDIAKINVTLKKPVQARFARFTFDVRVHCYTDEIKLFGTKYVASGTPTPVDLGIKDETTGNMLAPDEDVLGGVKDVMLAYHTATTAPLTKEVLLTYVAYLDKDRNIKDTMYDGYLFLPTVSALPSGGMPYKESIKTDWEYVLNSAFKENINIDALNQAVAETKTALGLPDYKVKVYYTLLYPSQTITNFGDVDGDGVSENLANIKDRLKAVEWYMDEFLTRFEAGNYENLEFCGFYWFHETINGSEGDNETIPAVSELVHKRDSQLFWIPYFGASGYYNWESYGFDYVCLQPNYVFSKDATKSRIKDTADLIKLFNMCIEIEFNNSAFNNDVYYERYMDYLKGGIYYGYMTGSIHMYYQGVMDFYSASISKSAKIRNIYDYTYQFIKGTLDIYPDKMDDITVTTPENTFYEGKLFEADATKKALVSISAQNGSVTVNYDGTFRYYPNKGFKGTDTFTFKITEGLDWSEDSVVTVTVG